MKIAFFLDYFPAISETFVLAQIVAILQSGHDVDIYAEPPVHPTLKIHPDVERFRLLERTKYPTPMPAARGARILEAAARIVHWGWRVPALTLDSLNVFRHGGKALRLRLVYDRLPPAHYSRDYDIIHCHYGPNGQRAVTRRKAGTLRGPVITTFHGYDVNKLPRIHGPDMYKDVFELGDLFTVGSEFMRRRIIALGAPADRIAKLPMGVDVSRFPFTARRQSDYGEFRLLTIGRLVEVKGIEYALRAVGLLKDKYPGLRYEIAGDGPLRSGLEALTVDLGLTGQVRFLGAISQDEAPRLYEAAHGFVLPSVVTESGEEENQPVVLAEAQASGLPVIASAIGGIPESIRADESGLLVPPRNPEALASAIGWLADHPESWSRMGHAGRTHVEDHYNLERLNGRLLDIYRTVLASAKTRTHR
jgi:colanic acid/amylovoran biosynthesis glycosyltransferase